MKKINNNIEETYCSFEVSKLLKEKGFEVPCTQRYWISLMDSAPKINLQLECKKWNYNDYDDSSTEYLSAPTHAIALKWIQINFNMPIFVVGTHDINKFHIGYLNTNDNYWNLIKNEYNSPNYFNSPEEAIESALLYCLKNLIK